MRSNHPSVRTASSSNARDVLSAIEGEACQQIAPLARGLPIYLELSAARLGGFFCPRCPRFARFATRGARMGRAALPMPADGLHAAAFAQGRRPARWASPQHPHVAQREVVSNRIGRVEAR